MSDIIGITTVLIDYCTDYNNSNDIKHKDAKTTNDAYDDTLPHFISLKKCQKRNKRHHLNDARTLIINIQ